MNVDSISSPSLQEVIFNGSICVAHINGFQGELLVLMFIGMGIADEILIYHVSVMVFERMVMSKC